jgi:hypothetical protein
MITAKEIDNSLSFFSDSGVLIIDLKTGFPKGISLESLGVMKTLGIIKPIEQHSLDFSVYKLSKYGFKIKMFGGWSEHLDKEAKKEAIETELMQSSIEANKTSQQAIIDLKEANKTQKNLLIATVVIAGINFGISIMDYNKSDSVFLLPEKQSHIILQPMKDTIQIEPICLHSTNLYISKNDSLYKKLNVKSNK